jgi:L-iditol 2-dehydrogenase
VNATTISSSMEALRLEGPDRFEVVTGVPVPEPGPGEVLCRVRAASICGTDSHLIAGDYPGFWPPSFPFRPGHEWSGEVVAVGGGAAELGFPVGTRVAGTSHAACGVCQLCVEGRYNVCLNYGREGLHAQYGHNAPGAFATYVVHSVKSVFAIPDELGFDEAALLDPASIAMHTAVRGGVRVGDHVIVTGAGVIGLLAAEAARALGAARVTVLGRGARLAKAGELGHETIDTTSVEDPAAAVRDRTGGRGADVALECAGATATLRWALDGLRRGGRCAVVGIPLEDAGIPMQRLVLDELELVGVRASAGELPRTIGLVTDGRIRLSELITHRFPLSRYAEALRVFNERVDDALKVVVQP